MRLSRSWRLAALGLILLAPASSLLAQRQRAGQPLGPAFDRLMDSTLALWKVPGIAIGIVKGDQVIMLKGYGVRNLESKAPVTPDTKFAIGSVTKSFTTSALAAEIGQKKVTWDTKTRDVLPDFRLYDDVATREMTLRDMLSHRSGLPRHDLMWYGSPLTRQQIFDRLRYLKPSREFRSYWQYNNLMFMTAGLVAAKLNGTSWEETVRQLIFQPLGMNTADFSVDDLQRSPDYASPYNKTRSDSVYLMPYRNIDQIGPAGSIDANAREMIKYVTMHLNRGKFDGKQIIPAAAADEMHEQQMVISGDPAEREGWYQVAAQQYGLAFFIGNYRGHKVVHHGGNIDGFSAEVNFLPHDSLGVVVLTNMNGTPTRDFIPYLIYDRLLGLSPIDWNARYKTAEAHGRARADSARAKRQSERKEGTQPSHPLADYTGTYTHPAYGSVTVSVRNGALAVKFNSFDLQLQHFNYDVFEVPTDENKPAQGAGWRIEFGMNQKGDVVTVALPLEPAVDPIVFEREGSGAK